LLAGDGNATLWAVDNLGGHGGGSYVVLRLLCLVEADGDEKLGLGRYRATVVEMV
jgi:hypothetical protein